MRIDGAWRLCDDGIVRPVITGHVSTKLGTWEQVYFQVDTGADCTAFAAATVALLGLPLQGAALQLGGLGGAAATFAVDASIRLFLTDGNTIVFKSHFAAFTDPAALAMSVLGRDITDLFALIVDRFGDVVCLLRQPHRYVIESN